MKKLNSLFIIIVTLVGAAVAHAQNNAALKGDYAFTFKGLTTGGGGASTPFAAVGRFTADGAGNLTNGELDTNGASPMEHLIGQAFTGTYTIGTDNRGVMNLNIPGGGTLAFAMMANGNAQFVEVDASGGHGSVGSGSIERSDTTAYASAKILGDYAFGFDGFDASNNRTAIAGRFSANGGGSLTNGAADINQSGSFSTWNLFTGTYMITDGNGRGVMNFPPIVGGTPTNLDFVFYVVDAGKLFAMETDSVTPITPLLNGAIVQQQTPALGFTGASVNGPMVVSLSGRSAMGCGGTTPAANVLIGLLTGNGTGGLTFAYDQNCGGVATSTSTQGSYTVTDRGRIAITLGTSYLAGYLVTSNEAFFVIADNTVLSGFGEPQASGAFTNSSIQGTYAGLTTDPMTIGAEIFSGEFTADGVSPTGTITGIKDIGAPSGASLGVGVSVSYCVMSAPVNGRGTINGGSFVMYVVSPSKFVVIASADANPAVLIFEQ